MSLFDDQVSCELTEAEREIVTRPVVGDGGAQRFLRGVVLPRLVGLSLMLDDMELLKCQRYAYAYGNGGFQERFRAILAAAGRADWKPL